ncbi:MAG: dual specificity protein phosphatase family protein [Snodgrassella sp.]|nr:dual specificity protein phosphatase family protein [Snodgrassella sp.]
MKNPINKLTTYVIVFSLGSICLLTSGCQFQIHQHNTLPNNFYKISDDLFRSEQPTAKEMQYLEKIGIKTVINLRKWHSDQHELSKTKLTEVSIKMRAGKITDEKVVAALRTIRHSQKPILIHCWHGSDRTGVIVAMYRIVFQNWTKSQAIDELMQPQFRHHYNVYPNIVRYIEHVDVEKIRAAVF